MAASGASGLLKATAPFIVGAPERQLMPTGAVADSSVRVQAPRSSMLLDNQPRKWHGCNLVAACRVMGRFWLLYTSP
jgi:hypothetical protein